MLDLFLKWLFIALIVLVIGSIGFAAYHWYGLTFGSCSNGEAQCLGTVAGFYIGLIGTFGFGISAISAFVIRRILKTD